MSGSYAPYLAEPVAAEEYDGDVECGYGCGRTADWVVELNDGITDERMTVFCCQRCNLRNRINVVQDGLTDRAISDRARD